MKNNYLMDLHTHSVLSKHAFSSLTENIEYAQSIGLKYLGVSEHQYDSVGIGSNPLVYNVLQRVIPNEYKGMRVLKGMELNICDRHFEVEKYGDMSNCDYTIASMHGYAYSFEHSEKENTDNYIMACNTPYVTILGHMDARRYMADFDAVVKEAAKNNKLIELNESSIYPKTTRKGARELDYQILKACVKYSCPIILDSDAHIKYDIGQLDSGFELLTEINFPEELVVNLNPELLKKYIKI